MDCCKKCQSENFTKKGFLRGLQRYKCNACGYHFTNTPKRGKPESMKAMAILCYGMGNMSFNMIGKMFRISRTTVMRWVKAEAENLPEPTVSSEVKTLAVDEMCHFLEKKLKKFGSGARMTLLQGELSHGVWVGVMIKVADDSSTRSA